MIFSEDITIIKALFKSQDKSIDLYDFHKLFLLSPGQISRSVEKLHHQEIIELNEKAIKLTKNGIDFILKNRSKIFFKRDNKYWKDIPENMWGSQIKNNELFLPTIFNLITFEKNIER